MPAKKEKSDVARGTILVLLVLTILLSVISTWYVLDMVTSVKQQYEAMPSITYAQISVGVEKPGESAVQPSFVTGQVTLAKTK